MRPDRPVVVGRQDAPVVVARREGSRPVVLLHGFSFDRRMWDDVVDRLPRDLDILKVELPGFGDAPVPASAVSPVEALAAGLADLGVRRADVVGHSYGGEIALGLALARPDCISTLTLIGSGLTGFLTSAPWKEHIQRVREAAAREGPDAALARWRSHSNFGDPGSPLRSRLTGLTDRYVAWHWTQPELVSPLPPLAHRLAEIPAPALVMVGDRDTEQARDMARHLASHLPDSHLVVLPGVGHVAPVEVPDLVAARIWSWLAAHPSISEETRP